ncbi:MAG TPA: proline dehydrogenase family protein [Candidatus Limnocylindrales bacterium]|nr:proline dehydrogenase family protein [Candidatus Limnocylindrales bacterium]
MSTDPAAASPRPPFHPVRSILLHLSESKRLAPLIIHNGLSRRVARRFVAGETLDEAIEAAREVNRNLQLASLDQLGENIADEAGAVRTAEGYLSVFDRIAHARLDANVSLKLTQLGLDLGVPLCQKLLEKIVAHATKQTNFVRVDMEGSAYTQRTIEIVKSVRAKYAAVGTVMQAYLYRTEQDIRDLLAVGCRIRLCKGAYNEPAQVAFPKKADVDANYVKLMKILLPSGIYHGIATHDPAMIQATKDFAKEKNIGHDKFEFQMLYGIRTDLQDGLVREGFRVRVYIPYGTDWFPYFMRRLAERPANLKFFLKSLLPRSS